MNPFTVKIDVRWSDLDANKHVGNSSYMNYTSYARVTMLNTIGLPLVKMSEYNIGPAVLWESFSFFKEIHANQTIYVTTEIVGTSVDGGIFSFEHNIYATNGLHLAKSILIGVWFDMGSRKMCAFPIDLLPNMMERKSVDCALLTRESLKNLPNKASDISLDRISELISTVQ